MNSIITHCLIWTSITMTLWTIACATKTTETEKKTTGKVLQVTIDADSDANMGSPVVVDVVSAYDAQLVKVLESSAASDWFASKNKYIDQFRDKIFMISREIAPGIQTQLEYTTEIEENPIATFIFASYHSPGEHCVKLEKFKPLFIKLQESEFVVSD
jgi:microcompartment protein CcmK/EutM